MLKAYLNAFAFCISPIIDSSQKSKKVIKELEDKYFAIKDTIGGRRRPKYPRKSRGRLMRSIEKEWQIEQSLSNYLFNF